MTTTRRDFMRDSLAGVSLGGIGLGGAAFEELTRSDRTTHEPRAKAVIQLFMAGAPSQLELFDPKPKLTEYEGKPLPPSILGDQRYAFIQANAGVLGARFPFAKHGASGAELGSPLRYLSKVADELCIVRSVTTDQFNHAPAQLFLNTGFAQPGRPCLGSWAVYGLGSWAVYGLGAETKQLPAYVVMSTGSGLSAGSALYSSGFLPKRYAATRFRKGKDPILNVGTPKEISSATQRASFDLIERLNRVRLRATRDTEIANRIASFEMAARLQLSAPELTDLSSESAETLALYGVDPKKPSFARACLLARRMVERGVRFVTIFHEGWDAHSDVRGNVLRNCRATDRASAALVADLRRRGILDETLVVWGGEFGRTPMVETNPALGRKLGRDHHPQAYTMWLAGGGTRAGTTHGATDDFGFHITEGKVHVHDLQATILHLLGLDHERLTYLHAGRDFRLTDVHGHVVRALLA